MILDRRCGAILLKILNSKDLITVKTLSQDFKISERTVRYDLNKIDDWLRIKGLDKLIRMAGKGVCIKESQKSSIKQLLKNIDDYTYINSPEERKKIITLKLLESDSPITLEELEKELYVSKNTIIKEFKELEEWFNKRDVRLVSKPRIGHYLEGEERKKRRAVIELMSEILDKDMTADIIKIINGRYKIDNSLNKKIKDLFRDIDINYIETCVRFAEKMLNREFTYNSYVNLVTHIALAIKRLLSKKEIKMPVESLRRIKEFKEFDVAFNVSKKLEEKFNVKIPEDEVGYIAIHLIGIKVQRQTDNTYENEQILSIAQKLIKDFEKKYGVVFDNKENLIKNLYIHLRPAIYRLKFGVTIDNPLLEEIKSKYKKVFETTKKISMELENLLGIGINENEIAYIAMHFGSALHFKESFKGEKVNVLVICGSGVGTSKLLAGQLKIKFPQINIVDTISTLNLDRYKNEKIDFIISTIEIECKEFPIIIVNPLLNDKDLKIIENTLNLKKIRNQNSVEVILKKIMNSILNHCDIKNYNQLQNEILYILKNSETEKLESRGGLPVLKDIITQDTIELEMKAENWEDAVRKSAGILLNKNYIEERYIEAIINNIKKIGPYIVIAPGIALPHARPENGVNKLSMSLVTLKKPVQFGNKDNDPVKLILTLAAVDGESHLKALSQLMELLNNKTDLSRIMESKSKEEILLIIEKYS